MDLPDRHMLLGMTLGAISAMALATIGPGMVIESFADGLLNPVVAPGFDTSRLVKFEGRHYQVAAQPWVSQDPTSTQVVKKVEGGNVSYVTIASTATGTYSSDVLYTNHVQYPGITVTEVARNGEPLSSWQNGRWFSFSSRGANSFYSVRAGDVRVTGWGSRTCVTGRDFRVC
jgi:hypothetical protein